MVHTCRRPTRGDHGAKDAVACCMGARRRTMAAPFTISGWLQNCRHSVKSLSNTIATADGRDRLVLSCCANAGGCGSLDVPSTLAGNSGMCSCGVAARQQRCCSSIGHCRRCVECLELRALAAGSATEWVSAADCAINYMRSVLRGPPKRAEPFAPQGIPFDCISCDAQRRIACPKLVHARGTLHLCTRTCCAATR
jgi:hypothetical protein